LCESCDYLYALTATPDSEVTKRINEYNGHNGDSGYFIYKVDPRDLIEANIILPPRISILKLSDKLVEENKYKLDAEKLIQYMKWLKAESPNVYQKVLVTCQNKSELRTLQRELEKRGKFVFSTCSDDGCKKTNEDGEFADEVDEVNFIQTVDSYEGDCFVLHIRQLIQGIDIKSLTACVIATQSHGDSSIYKKNIQIIGRTLRPKSGERGIDIEHRDKKYGEVLYMVHENYNLRPIINFIEKYYGIGYICVDGTGTKSFHNTSKATAVIEEEEENAGLKFKTFSTDEEFEYEDLLMNISEIIKDELLPMHRFLVRNGGKGIDVNGEIRRLSDNIGNIDNDYDSVVLLTNFNLQNAVKALFEKYFVEKRI
jgi:hypothetical protein